MALDTTTGAATAEAYTSVADATSYHVNRGNAAWASLTTAQMEQSLRKATDYMGSTYGGSWAGVRTNSIQALDWPRYNVVAFGYVVASDSIPTRVQWACAELALRAAAGDLLADQERGVVSETIGPISTTYDTSSPQAKRYPAVDRMLAPYLSGLSGVNVGLVRA